jgi:multiple sugar transport system substrate-binding protein
LIVLPALLLVAACTSKSDSQPEMAKEPTFDPSASAELVFQGLAGDTEQAFNDLYGNAIRSKFPQYTIKFIQSKEGTTLPDLVAQNKPIDIVYNTVEYMYEPLTTHNLLLDMSSLAASHQLNLSQFEPTLIDGIKNIADGKLFGIPITNMNQVLFYNKGIFDKFGVPYPKDGMTWDEALDLSKRVTRKDGDKQYLGLAASAMHILRMNQYSQPYLDPATNKPTFDQSIWNKLLQTYFADFAADQGYKDRSAELKRIPYRLELTRSQELAMFVFNSQFPFVVPDDMKSIQWDLVALPTFKDKKGIGSQASPFVMSVTSTSKAKDVAMEVIKYLTSMEMQTDYSKKGIMSVLKDDSLKKVYGSDSIFKEQHWSSVFYNQFAPLSKKSKYDFEIEKILAPAVLDVVLGKTDMNTMLRTVNEQTAKKIAELNSR